MAEPCTCGVCCPCTVAQHVHAIGILQDVAARSEQEAALCWEHFDALRTARGDLEGALELSRATTRRLDGRDVFVVSNWRPTERLDAALQCGLNAAHWHGMLTAPMSSGPARPSVPPSLARQLSPTFPTKVSRSRLSLAPGRHPFLSLDACPCAQAMISLLRLCRARPHYAAPPL